MRRSRLTLSSLALVTAAAAITTTAASATAAPTAPSFLSPNGQISVLTTGIDVTTSAGRHVTLSLLARHGDIGVDLTRTAGSGWGEDHTWSLNVPRGLSFSRQTGRGSVAASMSDTHRFGAIHLRLRQTRDWTAESCDKGSAAKARVHITGTVFFRTRSAGAHPWGQLGTATKPLTIDAHGHLEADNGCQNDVAGASDNPCVEGTLWSQRSMFGASVSFGGETLNEIDSFDFHVLPHTQLDVLRFDSLSVTATEPLVTRTDAGITIEVTAPPSSPRLTGHATIAADGAGTDQTQPCGSQGQSVTDTSWTKATLTNGSQALTLHPDLGQPVVARDGGGAAIDQLTVGATQPTPSPSPSATVSPTPSPTP